MTHAPGTRVRCEMTKWGGRPHWEFDGVVLGEDEHGEWLGFAAGTHYSRPGFAFVAERDHVGLVPPGRGLAPRDLLQPRGHPVADARRLRRSRCTST